MDAEGESMNTTKNPKLKQIRRGHRRFMAGAKASGAEFVRDALKKKPEVKS